jgi:hypothetical protein
MSELTADQLGTASDLSELERLRRENAALRQQLGLAAAEAPVTSPAVTAELPLEDRSLPTLDKASAEQEKIALFRSLFRGREDVYAVRWVNEKSGKKGYAPACEDPWSLRKGQPRTYLPLTDQVVRDHLAGEKTDAEVYDYVDAQVSVLKRMFARRSSAYKGLGVETVEVSANARER